MATKTISVSLEAYDRLASARVSERESFSKVICRAEWPERKGTAGDLYNRIQNKVPGADVKLLDEMQTTDLPPNDPWEQ